MWLVRERGGPEGDGWARGGAAGVGYAADLRDGLAPRAALPREQRSVCRPRPPARRPPRRVIEFSGTTERYQLCVKKSGDHSKLCHISLFAIG